MLCWINSFRSPAVPDLASALAMLRIFVYNVFCMIVTMGKGLRMKGYLSIRETSYKWGISERRVNQYVAQGRIPGVERFGRSWAIPEDAEKPADPRAQKHEGRRQA